MVGKKFGQIAEKFQPTTKEDLKDIGDGAMIGKNGCMVYPNKKLDMEKYMQIMLKEQEAAD